MAKHHTGIWSLIDCFDIRSRWFGNNEEAVFADVGVALLAILNAVRLQRMNWI